MARGWLFSVCLSESEYFTGDTSIDIHSPGLVSCSKDTGSGMAMSINNFAQHIKTCIS